MSVRGFGAALLALGVALGVLPLLPWYRVDAAGPVRRYSGLDVAGEVWTLPLLALLVVGCGIGLLVWQPRAGGSRGRWLGAVAGAAGVLALGVTLLAILGHDAAALPVGIADPPPAPLRSESAAFVAAAAAAAIAAVAFAWLRSGRSD